MISSSSTRARWILQILDEEHLDVLSQTSGIEDLPHLVQRLLALRKVSAAHAPFFLEPRLADLSDPFSLPDMRAGVDRILQAVARREKVSLYGDYDVDGVTSLSLMMLALQAYGLASQAFLPHRMDEGYGLSQDGLARCFEEHGKPDLLIAMDCGTSSVAEVAWMREQGVDCIIVDHHEPGEKKPDCVALINPKCSGEQTYFCTAGLTFKLAHALLKTQRVPGFDLREHLDLVAMGTVADLVPLQDENRILVKKGLEKIASTQRKGLTALKNVCGVEGLIQAHHIGYRLGPRLNAAGRLDTAQTALDLLLCDDHNEARDFAELLDLHNRERQEVELQVQREATAMLKADPTLSEAPCIVLGSSSWHQGVVGIVASRIMREFHRPTLLIAFDENGIGKGSGRSVQGISLVDALNLCRPLILKGGGHAMAAGVSLDEKNFEAFRTAMIAAVSVQITGDELTPRLHLDAEVTLAELAPDVLQHYLHLEPFGMGNPEPLFLCRNVQPQLPGNVLKEKHWKLTLRDGNEMRSAMWFNAPINDYPPPPWDIALRVQRQVWRGQESWQLLISEVRSAESS